MIFLNACVFCFVVGSVAKLIKGQEDAGLLALLAIAAVMARLVPVVADWVRGRLERDGRTPKRRA